MSKLKLKKARLFAMVMCAVLLVSSLAVFAGSDSGTATVNGVSCEGALYACLTYSQANSNAASGVVYVGNIDMWGTIKDNYFGGSVVSFTSADCERSSDSTTHKRIHLCASCSGCSVVSAWSTHYFNYKSYISLSTRV